MELLRLSSYRDSLMFSGTLENWVRVSDLVE